MVAKDRNFLARADKVSENYKKRIDKIKADIMDLSVSLQSDENTSLFIEVFKKENQLEHLEKEQAEHQDRLTELKEQAKKTASLNSFCAEVNRLARIKRYCKDNQALHTTCRERKQSVKTREHTGQSIRCDLCDKS